jgi:hypothetical protein
MRPDPGDLHGQLELIRRARQPRPAGTGRAPGHHRPENPRVSTSQADQRPPSEVSKHREECGPRAVTRPKSISGRVQPSMLKAEEHVKAFVDV